MNLINNVPKEFDDIKEEIKTMNKSLYIKQKKNAESKNAKVVKTKNGRIMLLSKCAVCKSKKS